MLCMTEAAERKHPANTWEAGEMQRLSPCCWFMILLLLLSKVSHGQTLSRGWHAWVCTGMSWYLPGTPLTCFCVTAPGQYFSITLCSLFTSLQNI